MMRKKIFCGLCIVSALWACSESPLPLEGAGEAPVELRAEVEQQYVTRANDGGFADGDQIGVFIVNYKDDKAQALQPTGNHADNVCFTYDEAAGKWNGSYQLYWKDKFTPVDAYGYYPYDGALSNTEAYPFSVEQDQRAVMKTGRKLSCYEQSDFLWAKKEGVVATAGAITLQHRHLMAGIRVTLLEGVGFDEGEWDKIQRSFSIENTVLNGTINLQEGTVKPMAGATASAIIPQQNGDTYRAVVIPQTVGRGKSLFSITIDNKTYRPAHNESMTYYSGKLHQFTYQVFKSLETGDYQLTLVNEAITAWENDPLTHNGSARDYLTIHVDRGQFLETIIDSLGLDPSMIINLKVTGCFEGSRNFKYIREHMVNLEALNMKDLRTKNVSVAENSTYGDFYDDAIAGSAFDNLASLRYFVFPDSLKAIGVMAFPGTSLCGSLILPEGLKYIGRDAFVAYNHRASNLSGELYIPSSVEYIGDNAFGSYDGYRGLCFTNELILPAKMKYLGTGAFTGCEFMTGTIHIPEGLTVLNQSWPSQIGGLAVVPDGVKAINGIGGQPTVLQIPEGVTEIERLFDFSWQPYQPFDNYRKKLRVISLPKTLRRIGEQAFAGCGFAHVDIPNGIEIIPRLAFGQCDLQDTLTLPSSVTKIEQQAFYMCKQLTAVVIPEDVGIIEGQAFEGCYSLDYIKCLGKEPPSIEENTFSGVEKDNFTVVVPEGAVEAYKNAPHWKEFKRISAYRNFVCRPMQAKLLNKSNVREVVLNANDSWKVSDCPSWIHVSPSSGYKKTELKVTIDAMPHNQGDREGAVTFLLGRNDEDGNAITCTYTVKQFDYEHEEDGVVSMQKATRGQRGGIDILFVGDGYDAEDIARGTYLTDMQQEMEYFFGVEPYKTYRSYFNVSAAMAMSYESGVVDSPDKWRNTKFSITWGASCSNRLVVPFEEIGGYVLNSVTNSPVTTGNIGRSLIICVPNSDAYEGLTAIYSDGSAIAVCPMSKLPYPNDARGIIQHEAGGHGWAKLGDEYVYHRDYIQICNCICCGHVDALESAHGLGWFRNLSLTGKYGKVEWKHLLAHEKYSDIVDIYEGGYMHGQGVFRSEVNSCMNNNVPYFSTWSRQLAVERIKWAAGETFSFDDFVANDSREYGDKFLTRGIVDVPWQQVKAMHSPDHGPVIHEGSITDYIKKKGGKR